MPEFTPQTLLRQLVRRRFWLPIASIFALSVAGMAAASMVAPSPAGQAAVAPTATPVPSPPGDASALALLGLRPRFDAADGQAFAEIVRFTQIAALPTPTAVPPMLTTTDRASRSYQLSEAALRTSTTLPRSSAIAAGVERWP